MAKYREIRRLRELADFGDTADPRAAMRELASEFPSALRELDRLPIATVLAREWELEGVVRGESPAPRWVALQLAVHDWLRLALRVKAAAGPQRDRIRALQALRRSPESADLRVTEADVENMLAPPDGRLVSWVYERVARSAGTTVEAVTAAFVDS